MERHLAVFNPEAGHGRGKTLGQALQSVWRKRGWEVDLVFTAGPADASEIVRSKAPDYDVIISGGGDGTLHEVLQGLDLDRHRLAVLPVGTGNDFAWLNGWYADPATCADRIAANQELRLDIGCFENTRFHNNLGFGFEAAVNHQSQRIRRVKGTLRYLVALLQTLPRAGTWQVEIDGDPGRQTLTLFSGAFMAGRRTGGLFVLCPDGDNRDGRLDLMIAERLGPGAFFRTLRELASGKAPSSDKIHAYPGARFTLRFDHPAPVYVDGEAVGMRDALEVDCLPGALRTF